MDEEDKLTVSGLTLQETREFLDEAAEQQLGVFDSFEALVRFWEGHERRRGDSERRVRT